MNAVDAVHCMAVVPVLLSEHDICQWFIVCLLLQEQALRLLQPQLTSATSELPGSVLFPRVLAAAASSSREMRTQALDCLVKAGADAEVAGRLVSPARMPAGPLQAFLAAVAEHHAEILSDGLGLLQAVKLLLPVTKHKASGHGHAAKSG